MGKKSKSRGANKAFEHPYPSRYGSHAIMISKEECPVDDELVICVDEKGPYVTSRSRLDSGIADPKRWGPAHYREAFLKTVETTHIEKEEKDIERY